MSRRKYRISPEIVSALENKELLSHFRLYRKGETSSQTEESLYTGRGIMNWKIFLSRYQDAQNITQLNLGCSIGLIKKRESYFKKAMHKSEKSGITRIPSLIKYTNQGYKLV